MSGLVCESIQGAEIAEPAFLFRESLYKIMLIIYDEYTEP